MITNEIIKYIIKLHLRFCSLLNDCKCGNINENQFNPFKEKL